ncbi:MAG: hypothetical protein N2561_01680 [Bacteroidetes bacterium]|nr:hypothetical protein [Bacteroidota bacterium]
MRARWGFFAGLLALSCRWGPDVVELEPLEPVLDPGDAHGVVADWRAPSWGRLYREAYDYRRARYVPLTFWSEYAVRRFLEGEEVRQSALASAWAVFYRDPARPLETIAAGQVEVDRFALAQHRGANFVYYERAEGPSGEFAQTFWGRPNRWALSGDGFGLGPDTLPGPPAPEAVPRLLNPDLEPGQRVTLGRDWRLWWQAPPRVVRQDTLWLVFEVWDGLTARVLERTLWACFPDDGYTRLPTEPLRAWRERVRARWPEGRQELELRLELVRQRLLSGSVRGYGPVWAGTAVRYRLESLRLMP